MSNKNEMNDYHAQQRAVTAALGRFQENLPHVGKGAVADAGKFSYSYATLEAVSSVVLPALAKQGLAWTCYTEVTENGMFVLYYELRHVSGGMISGVYPLPPPKTASQPMGSSITYAKRYALLMVTGVAPGGDDDDGWQASQPQQDYQQVGPPPTTQPPATYVETVDGEFLADLKTAADEAGLDGEAVLAKARDMGFRGASLADLTEPQGRVLMETLYETERKDSK